MSTSVLRAARGDAYRAMSAERFADGEIDADEYRTALEVLRAGRGRAHDRA